MGCTEHRSRRTLGAARFAGEPRKVRPLDRRQGLCRNLINGRIGRIKRVFKWAVAEELVAPSVFHGLQAVAGLRFGRTEARESEPVKPLDDADVEAVLPFVTPHVAAMIRLQRLTGMWPSDVTKMRPSGKAGQMRRSRMDRLITKAANTISRLRVQRWPHQAWPIWGAQQVQSA